MYSVIFRYALALAFVFAPQFIGAMHAVPPIAVTSEQLVAKPEQPAVAELPPLTKAVLESLKACRQGVPDARDPKLIVQTADPAMNMRIASCQHVYEHASGTDAPTDIWTIISCRIELTTPWQTDGIVIRAPRFLDDGITQITCRDLDFDVDDAGCTRGYFERYTLHTTVPSSQYRTHVCQQTRQPLDDSGIASVVASAHDQGVAGLRDLIASGIGHQVLDDTRNLGSSSRSVCNASEGNRRCRRVIDALETPRRKNDDLWKMYLDKTQQFSVGKISRTGRRWATVKPWIGPGVVLVGSVIIAWYLHRLFGSMRIERDVAIRERLQMAHISSARIGEVDRLSRMHETLMGQVSQLSQNTAALTAHRDNLLRNNLALTRDNLRIVHANVALCEQVSVLMAHVAQLQQALDSAALLGQTFAAPAAA